MPTAEELLDARTIGALADVMAAAGAPPAASLREAGARLDGLSFSGRVAAVRQAVLADLPDD
ncbi:hypothetical protein [Streptomyces sp. DH12]|uniref:hypothetical protein n=1 Tax=Streptomyces sp. DH12 TaxID=2857010 RepID=UPI0027D29E81|nr:hypothetical protein [Streptomyces sp. DH12]